MAQSQDNIDDVPICFQLLSLESEDQVPSSNLVVPATNPSGPYELAIGKDKFWNVGQVLKVSWWAREAQPVSDNLKRKVENVAKQWDAICNIGLDFGNYGDTADIRVAFMPTKRSWSAVGRDCLNKRKDQPTMNFGWLDDRSSDREIQSVVLHEFGHALGCIHEHQNPDAKIQWNEQLVFQKYKEPPNN